MRIPFNKPYLSGKETVYIQEAVASGKISGNGVFTKKCHAFFEERFGFEKCLLTTSCTDALEMCALLMNIGPEDEVILPSYTFVSTANAFALRGAKLIFADSLADHPNMDPEHVASLISQKTKAIVVVHYGGVACDMDRYMELGRDHGVPIIEDAAHAIDSYYKGQALGGIGDLGTFSFHETKNLNAGEGGMLVLNRTDLKERAEILWEKGTNRSAFFRGEVDKYNWVDLGSSFLPSELNAAYLYAQLEHLDEIQARRLSIWERYLNSLASLENNGSINLPAIPQYATNNAHLFHIICKDLEERTALIEHLKNKGILAVFHYLPLHLSPYFVEKGTPSHLPNSEHFANTLLRLPLYYELKDEEVDEICAEIKAFYIGRNSS